MDARTLQSLCCAVINDEAHHSQRGETATDLKEALGGPAVGDQTKLGKTGVGYFPPASPYASAAGLEAITGPRDLAKARQMVAESGYKGEPIVLMSPSDQASIQQSAQVASALLKSLGLNVQYTSLDWATMLQRRNSKELPSKGGWSAATGKRAHVVDYRHVIHALARGRRPSYAADRL